MVARNPELCALVALSLLLTFLPVFLSVEGLLLSTLAPFPLIVIAVKYPWRYALSLIGLEAGIFMLVGGWQALLSFSQYGVAPLVIAGAVRHRYSLSQIIASSVLIPIGIGFVCLVVYALLHRQPLSVLIATYLEQALRALHDSMQTIEQGPGDVRAPRLAELETLRQSVLAIFPSILVINHLLINTLNYVVARYYCSRGRSPIQLDTEMLTHWRASDYVVWVFITSGMALLFPVVWLYTVGLNVFLVTLVIYLLQGLAIAVFWGQRLPIPVGGRWLLSLIGMVIAGPLSVVLCIAAGLFDLWVDFRRLRRQPLVL
jgi:Predicted membrane protein (DUF2232)